MAMFNLPDLDCTVTTPLRQTAQWLIYSAERFGEPVLAWAFLPATIAPDRSGHRQPGAPAGEDYQMLARGAQSAAESLSHAAQGSALGRMLATQAATATTPLWMITDAPKGWVGDDQIPGRALPYLAARLVGALGALHAISLLHLDPHAKLIGFDGASERLYGLGIDIRHSLLPTASDSRAMARPGFSAPEMWDRTQYAALGPWTDIYAAAATLYDAITGEPPLDFRRRLRDPAGARDALIAAMRAKLAASGTDNDRLAEGIAAALEPRIADRPATVDAWAAAMGIDPNAKPVAPTPTPEPAPVPAPQPEPEPAKAAPPPPPPSRTPLAASQGRDKSGGGCGVFAWPIVLVAVIAVALATFWMLRRIPTLSNTSGPSATSNTMTIDDRPKPTPTPTPADNVRSGVLNGLPWRDDPHRLSTMLGTVLDSVPVAYTGRALFASYRQADDTACTRPMRIHLRADGSGLLIDRPSGIVWSGDWEKQDGATAPVIVIRSVLDANGSIDRPGLVGSLYRVTLLPQSGTPRTAGYKLEIASVDADPGSEEREVYEPCF